MTQHESKAGDEAVLLTADAMQPTDSSPSSTVYGNNALKADKAPIFDNPIGLLTVDELAGILGFAPKTIRNWVAKHFIPFVRVGGKTFFRRESIETWLKRKENKPWR